MTITFVTAFLKLDSFIRPNRSIEKCFQLFQNLVTSDIQIVVFLSKEYEEYGNQFQSNTIVVRYIELHELETYKETNSVPNLSLPVIHSAEKDTKEFMILMNSKIECIKRAIDMNPFQSTHYAWIDFSIYHVFKESETTTAYLKSLSNRKLQDCIILPGCWGKSYQYEQVWNAIHWRFCGGFFIGDIQSLLHFEKLYRAHYTTILQKYNKLLWEVNIWTILEQEYGWNPEWFHGDHNDSIVRIPEQYFLV